MNFFFVWNFFFLLLESNGSFLMLSFLVDQVEFDFMVVLMFFVIFLVLFGNGLVILVFYCFCEFCIVMNYFVVFLVVVDIFVVFFFMFFWMYICFLVLLQIFSDKLFDKVFYYLWQYVDILCSIVFIVNFCMISVDRYLVINLFLIYYS